MPFESDNSTFFLAIMKELQNKGVLDELILIGGWCLYFYQVYFNNDPKVPILRTADIDFLIPRPIMVKKEVNIHEILSNLKFKAIRSLGNEFTKYIHRDLEIEFLAPELGRGQSEPFQVPQLHIEAVTLRYLNLLQAHIITINYNGITIKVPEPAAFALHKYILSTIRQRTSQKSEKDLITAQALSKFLLTQEVQRHQLKLVYDGMPKSWQKKLMGILKIYHMELINFLV